MPINKIILAAYKAVSHVRPSIKKSYKMQREVEEVSSKLAVHNPRCRIEDAFATMEDGYQLPYRIFTPLEIDISFATGLQVTEDSRGTILFFHGGGWVKGNVDTYTEACITMALELERRVVAVDYRLAPEHRFPQAPEDCYEVTRQLFAGTLLQEVDTDNIVLFGDSAGGNLAAVVSLMARDRGAFMPKTQMLLYPATYNDHSPTSLFDSVRENGEDYLLTSRNVEEYMELYRSSREDLTNPYFAPLLSPSLANQPRTLMITAEFCPLRDEGETYAYLLSEEVCQVACYRVLNAIHGYLTYPSIHGFVKNTYLIIKHFLDGDKLDQRGEPAWLRIPMSC